MATRVVPAPLAQLPNALTILRLLVVPVFVVLLYRADGEGSYALAGLFAAAALTDQIDGFLARRWHVESEFGRFADPLADRLMIDAAVLLLCLDGRLPWLALVIVLARDAILIGGYGFVSVSHTHHDYPAADIAAPEGAPVFALADSIVLDAIDDDRCGTGILLQTGDGIQWLYCHLSQRDAAVVPGTVLFAGQWVGLVGSTGHSTGPHLHLALKPETSYPQDMPWFQEFAGIAFVWQDESTGEPFRSSPIFAAVPTTDVDEGVIEFTTAPSRG